MGLDIRYWVLDIILLLDDDGAFAIHFPGLFELGTRRGFAVKDRIEISDCFLVDGFNDDCVVYPQGMKGK